jgi:hypothetical protein
MTKSEFGIILTNVPQCTIMHQVGRVARHMATAGREGSRGGSDTTVLVALLGCGGLVEQRGVFPSLAQRSSQATNGSDRF